MKFITKIIGLIIGISLLTACEAGMDKKYSKAEEEHDLISLSKRISSEDLTLLKNYIRKVEAKDDDLEGYTYDLILTRAKQDQEDEQYYIRAEKAKIEKEKIIQQKKELLCAHKWNIKECALQVEVEDDSEETIESVKKCFELQWVLKEKNIKHSLSVVKDSFRIFVRAKLDPKQLGFRQKVYLKDGTSKEIYVGNKFITSSWEFIDTDKIFERKPLPYHSRLANKQGYTIEIRTLDEKTFCFTRTRKEILSGDNPVSYFFIMKADR